MLSDRVLGNCSNDSEDDLDGVLGNLEELVHAILFYEVGFEVVQEVSVFGW
jgi:hypothetical protein